MARIESSIQVDTSIDKIWEIISDLDNEPKFWKGTKSIENISREGDKITREITIAFRDQKCLQEVILYPKKRIEAEFIKGIINGTKTINISPNGEGIEIEVIWDIRLSGMMSMFTGMIKTHIKNGTEQALTNIKDEAER